VEEEVCAARAPAALPAEEVEGAAEEVEGAAEEGAEAEAEAVAEA
jgi:hypothetical protein